MKIAIERDMLGLVIVVTTADGRERRAWVLGIVANTLLILAGVMLAVMLVALGYFVLMLPRPLPAVVAALVVVVVALATWLAFRQGGEA